MTADACCGCCVFATGFVKMMAYFDPSKKNIAVNDVKALFRKLDKGKGAELAALRTFFGTDC